MRLFTYLIILFIIIVGIAYAVNEYIDLGDYRCFNVYCDVSSIDQFDDCIEVGKERDGLYNINYYMCEGYKIPYTCFEKESEWIVIEGKEMKVYHVLDSMFGCRKR